MRIEIHNSLAVCIDIQERLFPHIFGNKLMEAQAIRLTKGLQVLEVPTLMTEQYTKGLGFTISSISGLFKGPAIEKQSFSCCDEPKFQEHLELSGRRQVILYGIESHVCVLQTAIDLMDSGFQAVLVEDACSSRKASDKRVAIRRMARAGVVITTVESLLFELLRFSGGGQFKQISLLIR